MSVAIAEGEAGAEPDRSAYIIVDALITNQTLGDARRPLGQS